MTTLTQLLTSNLIYCLKRRGYENHRSFPLGHGLVIVLYVDEHGAYHLDLRRLAPVWPSDSEVGTVLRHWPAESKPPIPPELHRREWTNKRTGAQFNCVSMEWKAEKAEMGARK